jgi:hypothetical protein
MSDPENFISRWSRRKRDAVRETDGAAVEPQRPEAASAPRSDNADREMRQLPVTAADEPLFDLSKLPSIESITAETDIRPFLAPGVPPELSRAALRRAWEVDPKIRDFVGLADYDWDFNTPGAIAGFGELEMTPAVREQIARIVGDAFAQSSKGEDPVPGDEQPPRLEHSPLQPDVDTVSSLANTGSSQEICQSNSGLAAPEQNIPSSTKEDFAAQHRSQVREHLPSTARRAHGTAIPK